MAEILVLVERSDGVVRKATLELLTLARRLGEPTALVCGRPDEAAVKVLGAYGATRVYAVENPDLEDYLVAPKADALVAVVQQTAPAAVLVTAGREGTEVAARAAVRLDSGIITGAVDVMPGEGGPVTTQSVCADTWTTQSQVVRGTPIITVRPNAVVPEEAPNEPVVESVPVTVAEGSRGSAVVRRTPKVATGRPDLADASVVVAGGRGMGSAEAFEVLERLADELGGAVAASRAATDLGWYGHDFQIGQTGQHGGTAALSRQRHLGRHPAPCRHAGVAGRSSRSTRTRRHPSSPSRTSAWWGTRMTFFPRWSRRSDGARADRPTEHLRHRRKRP